MALPIIKTIADCADFSKTITPYLPQLYALPNLIYTNLTDTAALGELYKTTNPAISSLAFSIATFPIFLIVSEANANWSQVDRVWSILPTVFNAHYATWARMNGIAAPRVDSALAVSVVWSLRLTYNYWRKGGYQIGSEDYRWEIIKKRIGRFGFLMLNLLFISTLQILVLWAVTAPTYILLLTSRVNARLTMGNTVSPHISAHLDAGDSVFSRVILALVVFEYFADQQMWDYQQAKKSYQATARVPEGWTRAQMDRGFVTKGLWQWSRHPNFAAEQTIWVLFYMWGCYQSHTAWNWTFVGMISYLLVFQGSTPLTERISSGKYPEYRLYQERVGKFLPKLWGKRWDEAEMEKVGARMAAAGKQK